MVRDRFTVKNILHPWIWRVDPTGSEVLNPVLPQMWHNQAMARDVDRRMFCTSVVDVFGDAIPDAQRQALYGLIAHTSGLEWLLPTRHIGKAAHKLPERIGATLPNAWIGVTISNQSQADADVPVLLDLPVVNRFALLEPLLGPIDLRPWLACADNRLDWVLAGGECGREARPMHPKWIQSVRDQCTAAGVPFFFRQWGEFAPRNASDHVFESGRCVAELDPECLRWPKVIGLASSDHDSHDCDMQRVGRVFAGRLLNGRTWSELPD